MDLNNDRVKAEQQFNLFKNAVVDKEKFTKWHLNPLIFFFNRSFFLVFVPFKIKWNQSTGSFEFKTNIFQTV